MIFCVLQLTGMGNNTRDARRAKIVYNERKKMTLLDGDGGSVPQAILKNCLPEMMVDDKQCDVKI